ncbi:MAG: hypothetical protein HOV71_06095 [Hamadaea sp.]|nr:hypothetical protein [Hamadaea sp.]NUT06720.1 hypothetical protein [Hamadaea sp.]
MDVMSTTFLPVLVSLDELDPQDEEDIVLDEFVGDLAVGYAPGPAYQGLVTWRDLHGLRLHPHDLRRYAFELLTKWAAEVQVDGRPPVLMLSFGGWESSAVLLDEFWERLAGQVPGELVLGVPARDVVMVTGSGSPPGVEKVRRAVDRMFFAGGRGLLSRDLLVWRRGWEIWRHYPPHPH